MPRTKSRSSEIAGLIDTASSMVERLKSLADNIADVIEKAQKYDEIRPILNRLDAVLPGKEEPVAPTIIEPPAEKPAEIPVETSSENPEPKPRSRKKNQTTESIIEQD